jgi:transcriptional regulator with XRE-family HTH domain
VAGRQGISPGIKKIRGYDCLAHIALLLDLVSGMSILLIFLTYLSIGLRGRLAKLAGAPLVFLTEHSGLRAMRNSFMDLRALGRRIRSERERLGMTQAQLAAEIGVSRSAVAQWETGRSGQVGGNLARVAEALGMEVGSLLLGRVSDPGSRHLAENLTGNERALVELYRALQGDDQGLLLRFAHRLLSKK